MLENVVPEKSYVTSTWRNWSKLLKIVKKQCGRLFGTNFITLKYAFANSWKKFQGFISKI